MGNGNSVQDIIWSSVPVSNFMYLDWVLKWKFAVALRIKMKNVFRLSFTALHLNTWIDANWAWSVKNN